MKKIVLNISDTQFEKFRIEALNERKSIADTIKDRIFHKPFSTTVETYFDQWLESQIKTTMNM